MMTGVDTIPVEGHGYGVFGYVAEVFTPETM